MRPGETISDLQAFSSALQGFVFGVVLMFFGLMNITIYGHVTQFTFLPVLAVLFWPRQASYTWSLIFVFLLGLLIDLSGGAVLGVWSLSLLVLYMVLGGGLKQDVGLLQAFAVFLLSLVIVMMSFFLLGRLALGQWISPFAFVGDAVLCLFVFPFVFWVHKLMAGLGARSQGVR